MTSFIQGDSMTSFIQGLGMTLLLLHTNAVIIDYDMR